MSSVNRYSDLATAARSLLQPEKLAAWSERQLSPSDTTEYLRENESVFATVRALLAEPVRVPVEFSAGFFALHADDIVAFRNLVRALMLKTDRLRFQGLRREATETVLDALRLSNACRNGGLVVDMLVTYSFAGMAFSRLRKMRSVLEPELCLLAARGLDDWDEKREPFDLIAERDAQWEQAVNPTSAESPPATSSLPETDDPAVATFHQAVASAIDEMAKLPATDLRELERWQDAQRLSVGRLLIVELALRAFHAKHGNYPETLTLLVPEFLRRVPLNPCGEEPIRYLRTKAGYSLYFIGPSGKDNGGSFGSWNEVQAGKADIGVDVDDAPRHGDSPGPIGSIINKLRSTAGSCFSR